MHATIHHRRCNSLDVGFPQSPLSTSHPEYDLPMQSRKPTPFTGGMNAGYERRNGSPQPFMGGRHVTFFALSQLEVYKKKEH